MLQAIYQPISNFHESFYLNHIFLHAVQTWPTRVALESDGKQWTYFELYKKVIQYADYIKSQIDHNDAPGCIAIYGNKSFETVAAILAVLLSGNAYMPLDISWPAHRIEMVLAIAKPKALIQTQLNQYLQKQFDELQSKPKIIDICTIKLNDYSKINQLQNKFQSIKSEQIAYLLFTSGTTGIPKGVCVSHRAASSALEMLFEHVSFNHNDKIANQSAFCYDLAMFDLFSAFKVGASVYLMPTHITKVPKEFIDCIINNNLTSLFIVNSAIEYILKYTSEANYKLPLTNLLLTGDSLTENLFGLLKNKLNEKACIWNLYSAVEMPYAFAQRVLLNDSNQNFKLFYQCGSKINYYLENNNALSDSEGALRVRSEVLFSGYITEYSSVEDIQNNPIRDYNTGDWVRQVGSRIELFGRIDRQVKIMGNRVELDDIEINLEKIPYIREAAVCFHPEKSYLIAFITVESELENKEIIDAIKKSCQKLLPPIMNPNKFVVIDAIPRTTSDKKDRKILMSIYKDRL